LPFLGTDVDVVIFNIPVLVRVIPSVNLHSEIPIEADVTNLLSITTSYLVSNALENKRNSVCTITILASKVNDCINLEGLIDVDPLLPPNRSNFMVIFRGESITTHCRGIIIRGGWGNDGSFGKGTGTTTNTTETLITRVFIVDHRIRLRCLAMRKIVST
jgi:hypothetical protein